MRLKPKKWLKKTGLLPVLAGVLIAFSFFVLYIRHLGSLTVGLSSTESAARLSSHSLRAIYNNPINTPHRLPQYIFQKLGYHGATSMRLVSVVFIAGFLFCLYKLLRSWFGRMPAVLGTLIFAVMPWTIISARSATPDILLLAPIVLLTARLWLNKSVRPAKVWWIFCACLGISLYIPGMLWFIAVGGFLERRKFAEVFKEISRKDLALGGFLFLVLLVPLIHGFIYDWRIIKPLLLIPANFPSILETLKLLAWSMLAFVWRAPTHIPTIIGRLAVMDAVQIVLVAFGIYALWSRARHETYLLSTLLIIGIIGSALNQNIIYLTIALPAIAVLVTAGLRYLYREWRAVFPLNPLPKGLAIALIVVLVGMHAMFGMRYALIAWPHSVATRQVYVLK